MTWQVVPTELISMLKDRDPERARRVTERMMMKKLDIAALRQA